MPVGCLSSRHVDSSQYLSVIQSTDSTIQNGNGHSTGNGDARNGNPSVSAQADTIALMQQTLLIQIFRRESIQNATTANSATTAVNGGASAGAVNGTSSGSGGVEAEIDSECPTCQAFSDSCCQEVEGLEVFQEVQEANSAMFWNLNLVKAILGLKYQGYVCPGILVTLTDTAGVKVLEEAWSTHTLATPPQYTIYRLGLSGGCSVTPFQQLTSPSLPDSLCLILYKLKQAECVADMNTILSRLARDFPALNSNNLPATVHAALGSLIKKRKVYYTGKGYFLVSPDPASIPRYNPKKCYKSVRKVTRENACQTESNLPNYQQQLQPYNNSTAMRNNSPSTVTAVNHLMMSPLLAANGGGYRNHQGLALPPPSASPSCSSSSGGGSGHEGLPAMMMSGMGPGGGKMRQDSSSRSSPRRKGSLEASPRHSPQQNGSNGVVIPPLWGPPLPHLATSTGNSSADSSMQDSPRSSNGNSGGGVPTLERSQSLRISKKSLRQMSKGGSLRLSKKEALSIMSELEEGHTTNTKDTSATSDEHTSPSPKKMERKNSFLGRFFGRKKSGTSPKKEILTFSAQFPPPDMEIMRRNNLPLSVANDQNTVETQTPPHVRRRPTRPNLNASPLMITATTKNGSTGPNNNYYEREYGVITRQQHQQQQMANNIATRPLPKSPQISGYSPSPAEQYDGSSHIYSQPSHYGFNSQQTSLSVAVPQHKPPPPAYTSAPPYQAKSISISAAVGTGGGQMIGSGNQQRSLSVMSSPSPQRPALVTSPNKNTQQKQVHFAATPRSNDDKDSPRHHPPSTTTTSSITSNHETIKSPLPVHRNASLRSGGSGSASENNSSGHSSLTTSGPSSIDSVLYDDTLIVIEKSNKELELRLDPKVVNGGSASTRQNGASPTTTNVNNRMQLTRHRVDTIHNNRHLEQEVIYEDDDNGNSLLLNGGTGVGIIKNSINVSHHNNHHTGSLTDISRSSSQSTLKPDYHAPDHPSLSDLGSIADLSSKFQSLTARKLMAGLSISSIDTLLEVNIDAEAKLDDDGSTVSSSFRDKLEKLDESTETIDFGVI